MNQPVTDFPVKLIAGQNRKFNAAWYERFSWIDYDIGSDSAYCGICRSFPKLTNNNNKANFTELGFSDWKNAIFKFNKHQESQSHKDNEILWINKKNFVQLCSFEQFSSVVSRST